MRQLPTALPPFQINRLPERLSALQAQASLWASTLADYQGAYCWDGDRLVPQDEQARQAHDLLNLMTPIASALILLQRQPDATVSFVTGDHVGQPIE